jgi:hypothetical protein
MFYSFGSLTPSASYSCLSRFLCTSTISGCHRTRGWRSVLDMWEQECKKSKEPDAWNCNLGAGSMSFNYTGLSFQCVFTVMSVRFQRGLRHGSGSALFPLSLRVRFPPGAWMSVCCECCVLSGRGLRYGPITRPEESNQLSCVVVYDLETLKMRRPQSWPCLGPKGHREEKKICCLIL